VSVQEPYGHIQNGHDLVDDEEIMREILETLLTREGYTVRLASSGAEGLELARAMPFDAAIVDIMMPGIDGIATLDELKRIDEDLAVLIITAYASVGSAISAMKAIRRHRSPSRTTSARRGPQWMGGGWCARTGTCGRISGALQVREHHREEPADAAGVRPDYSGGASQSTILVQGGAARAGWWREPSPTRPSGRPFVAVNSGNLPGSARVDAVCHVRARLRAPCRKKRLFDLRTPAASSSTGIGNVRPDAGQTPSRHPGAISCAWAAWTRSIGRPHYRRHNGDLKQMTDEGSFREDLFIA
jgi:CheY-like chemotaxis protein